MGFGKSFGIGLLIFVVLNFVMNLLLAVAGGAYLGITPVDISEFFGALSSGNYWWFFSHLFTFSGGLDLSALTGGTLTGTLGGLMPASFSILIGAASGISLFTAATPDYFLGIVMILGPILPGLIAAIVAGKMADTPPQGFGSMILISVVSAVALLIFYIVDSSQMANHLAIAALISGLMGGGSADTLMYIAVPIMGLFFGMFWSGISAVLGREF